ncbi:MAG: IS4 family transposase [Saprospiraceae bacterium]
MLQASLVRKQKAVIQQLEDSSKQADQVYHFLSNPRVSQAELIKMNCSVKPEVLAGRHVLVIGDSTSFNLSKHQGRIQDTDSFGVLNDNKTLGFHSHIQLVVDAQKEEVLGLADIIHWVRSKSDKQKAGAAETRSWQEKESYKWALGASNAQKVLQSTGRCTFLFDREADDFQLFDHLIWKQRADFIIRSDHNRRVQWDEQALLVQECLDRSPAVGTYEVDLPALDHYSWTSGKRIRRKARRATFELRYESVEVLPPKGIKAHGSIKLWMVEAREITDSLPVGEKPVVWRLWTTHPIQNAEQARQIVHYYTLRWIIEQLFSTIKKKGFDIEATQLETYDAILRQTTMVIKAACKVLQLTYARNRPDCQPTSEVFEQQEQQVLQQVNERLQGNTAKQKNPFPQDRLSWASWIIARLGGWKGYQSQKPPGPITMKNGLDRFAIYMEAFELFNSS